MLMTMNDIRYIDEQLVSCYVVVYDPKFRILLIRLII